ncbi:SAF domain-containing protein [Streptomyces sp. NBC_00140]|uniref:SAF domain-containing protein n=1 Tax=Streptomyces sp. NBC_00140 TaxID=2975664 RepID=UPI002251CE35|nr:SAF domain-containing protein [Streptomyces sp. NBC_00140]MCX5327801.1 SAF domain-containing protein [Streptomyces sp. NBC_00140]MCX5336832.1 SAF domain-containing protein [Streptomyces sp. NBC_00140]
MSTTQERPAPSAGVPPQGQVASPVRPPRVSARRRRPGMIALSLALIAAGGAGVAVLLLQVAQRTEVVTVVRDVQVGQVLTEQDLGQASVALDPAVKAVEADELESVVGKRAAVELKPGSLLTPSQVTKDSLVKAGEQLVPIGLKPEQVPATALVPGQKVRLVHVPAPGAAASESESDAAPKTLAGRVVKASAAAPGSGVVVVDVATAAADGPTVAAWVAAGTLRLVLDAPDGS